MRKTEAADLGISIEAFLDIAKDNQDLPEVSNAAVAMCKQILEDYPKIRHFLWEASREDILDEFKLDYGSAYLNKEGDTAMNMTKGK